MAPGLMVLPSAAAEPVVEGVISFADVPDSSLFYKEISWLAAEGISTGWDVGGGLREYRPLSSIARDAMAAFLYRKAGSPDFAPPAQSPFSDVTSADAFYKEITWLASKGISTGWDMGGGRREYRPLNPIARDAMAAFLFRFAEPGEFTAPAQSPFVDVASGGAFYREITWLASSGISTGWDIGGGAREYRPLNGIARDAMAAFLYRHASEKVPTNPLDSAAGTVTVAPDVEVLDAAQLDTALVSGGTLTLPSDEAAEIRPNDVLVAGVTPSTPEGLLARVAQVTRDPGGNTIVHLKPATLTEAIVSTSGLLEIAGTPVSSSFIPEPDVTVTTDQPDGTPFSTRGQAQATTSGEVFSQSFSVQRTIKSEVSTDELSGDGSINLDSSIRTSARAKMTLEKNFLQLREASVVLTPTFTSRHSLGVSGTLEGTASAPLGILRAVIVFPTAIPVVVTAEAQIAVNVSAAGTADISYVTAHAVSSDMGFKYRDGSFALVNTKPQVTGVQNAVQATASLTARAALDFDADIRFYGIAGITIGAGPYASAPIAVSISNEPHTWSCPLEIGFEGRLGVVAGIEVMGFKLENSDGVSASWKLLEADPCQGTPPVAPAPTPAPTDPTPPPVVTPPPPLVTGGIADIITGNSSYAIYETGTVWAWGDSSYGQLGDGSTGVIRKTPFELAGLGAIKEMTTTNANTWAVGKDGTLYAWGSNQHGQLGQGNTADSFVPKIVPGISNVVQVRSDGWGVLALKDDGTVWSWGSLWGHLGYEASANVLSPTKVPSLAGVKDLTLGREGVAAYALKNDGTVWAWGGNDRGQLGDGTTVGRRVPAPIPNLDSVIELKNSHQSTYALKQEGTVWAWGANSYGVLGDGTYSDRTIPVKAVGLNNIVALPPSGSARYALRADGTIWAWGYHPVGTGIAFSTPTPFQFSALTSVTQLAPPYALRSDGTVWAWGNNHNGELGNETMAHSKVPVQVPGVANVSNIYSGHGTAYAVLTDGTAWTWGLSPTYEPVWNPVKVLLPIRAE